MRDEGSAQALSREWKEENEPEYNTKDVLYCSLISVLNEPEYNTKDVLRCSLISVF